MIISSAKFQCSSERTDQCPELGMPEFAFIGRSNVGKSSLINMLAGISSLAKVSGTPGKTRLINHFIINDQWALVDLPGYGYAKTSKKNREVFDRMIRHYILNREQMTCLCVLIDIRLEPQEIDLKFIQMLGENGVPFVMIFTKADKISATARKILLKNYHDALSDQWDELPKSFITSSEKKIGKDTLLDFIQECVDNIE